MVFGLFSKEAALKRAAKKATNKLAQSPDRWAAMEKLVEDGSEESLYTLCRRFSITSTKLSEDEQEKEWVVDALTSKGEAVLPALQRYLKAATAISYPLRVLANVSHGSKRALEVIDQVLADEVPGYTRDPEKRIDIINWLAEYKPATDQEVAARVAPYLVDRDENTRFAAVETLYLRPADLAAEPLVTALLNPDEESGRLKLRIAETLCDRELDLCGKKDEVALLLEGMLDDFRLHRNKLVRKKLASHGPGSGERPGKK